MEANDYRVDLSLMHKDESVKEYLDRVLDGANYRIKWTYEEFGCFTYADIVVL